MIIFKHKRENKYLITNYKVMFSSLVNQPSLKRISNKSFVIQKTLEIFRLQSKAKVYFLLRHPELRLQSFFQNKFRQHIHKTNFGDWEHCQRIFFDLLDIKESDNASSIKEKILDFKYEDFIKSLKNHYQKDAHLIPQSTMQNLAIMGISIPIKNKPDAVYLMEKEEDLKKLQQTFNLDLAFKANVSHKNVDQYLLPKELSETIWNIYNKDFTLYSKWN